MRCGTNTILLLAAIALLAGCKNVEPWERGNLAKPQMALDPNPMQSSILNHVRNSREAAAASNAGVGGGCGCY